MIATIRPRTDADLDACVEVMQAVYASDGYPVEGLENGKSFLGTGPSWVAELDGTIVGHIAISEASPGDVAVALWRKEHATGCIAVLGRLMVHPEKRGGGTASKLIEAATAWARDNQTRLVLLGLNRNAAAVRLYERLGWLNYGETTYIGQGGRRWDGVCFASPLASQ